jgi:hypothetical protein
MFDLISDFGCAISDLEFRRLLAFAGVVTSKPHD